MVKKEKTAPATRKIRILEAAFRDIDEITDFIREVVFKKEPRHHINDREFVQPARTMSFIGG